VVDWCKPSATAELESQDESEVDFLVMQVAGGCLFSIKWSN